MLRQGSFFLWGHFSSCITSRKLSPGSFFLKNNKFFFIILRGFYIPDALPVMPYGLCREQRYHSVVVKCLFDRFY